MQPIKIIYIECSFLSQNPDSHTGIQRVVRKVIEHFEQFSEDSRSRRIGQDKLRQDDLQIERLGEGDFGFIKVVPVDIAGGRFRPVTLADLASRHSLDLKEGDAGQRSILAFLLGNLKQSLRNARGWLAEKLPSQDAKHFLLAPRNQFGLLYLIDRMLLRSVAILKQRLTGAPSHSEVLAKDWLKFEQLCGGEGDVLLMADSSWSVDIWPSVDRMKASGVRVFSIIYDLIPLTHPQFCVDAHVSSFERWFFELLERADGFLAISNTVKKDLLSYLENHYQGDSKKLKTIQAKYYDYFILGGDLREVKEKTEAPSRQDDFAPLKQGGGIEGEVFKGGVLEGDAFEGDNTYLMVSTLDPRKNHQYLLDAFDLLWLQGSSAKLCFVGRQGWKVDELMQRIENHPYLGKKLFHWSNLNDGQLLYCYRRAKMLLFPSIVEGFGLPIVEGLVNQLPVMASDTPIHREVGGDRIAYFDLSSPQSLVDRLVAIEKFGIPDCYRPGQDYQGQSWQDSAQQLWRKILLASELPKDSG